MIKYLFLFTIMVSQTLWSQNYLFDDGSSGPHFATQASVSKESYLLAITPSFTIDGRLSVGVGLGSEKEGKARRSSLWQPYASVLMIKQQKGKIPLSISLEASHRQYRSTRYRSTSFSTVGMSLYYETSHGTNSSAIFSAGPTLIFSKYANTKRRTALSFGITSKLPKANITLFSHIVKEASSFGLQVGWRFPKHLPTP